MRDRWLVLDIGNTHTVAGIFDGQLSHRIRFRTDPDSTSDEYRAELSVLLGTVPGESPLPGVFPRDFSRIIVSTVVPALERIVREACAGVPCLFINSETRRDFDLDLPSPSQLGADRLANVAGALQVCSGPLLIVDAGTATTFCLVDRRPAYVGGAIVPGMEISWKALKSQAAKLFSIELTRPSSSVGRTTESQIQSGVLIGYESLIEEMTDRLLADAGPEFNNATLFATGGCIRPLKLSPRFRVEHDLTLSGLIRYGQLTE